MLSFDWSSLLIFGGVVNTILSIVVLVVNRNLYKQKFSIWIILFLVLVGLILSERIIRFSNLESKLPELLFVTSPLFFFILPLLYIFQCELNNANKKWHYHLIVPVLMLILLLPTITMSNKDKLAMYLEERAKDPIWIVVFYFLFAAFYSVRTFRENRVHKCKLFSTLSSNDIELQLFSNKLIYFSSTLITIIPVSFFIQYFEFETRVVDKLLYVVFSFIPHIILFSIITRRTFSGDSEFQTKQTNNDIDAEELEGFKAELTSFMLENQPYLNQSLTLQALANKLSWNRTKLSMVINKGFGKNFYDYINEYRLESVLEKLGKGVFKEYSLDYIVGQSGFKNYTSFYRIFKKVKKKSPKDYLSQLNNS